MARRSPSLTIVHDQAQKFACRECPARCCTAPWAYPVTREERDRILADEQAVERLTARGEAILRVGVLPARERGGSLACVFLDDDLLCSLQKRHGHAFLPAACQAFPFGFAKNERGQTLALASRYCPSVRENRGDPIGPLLDEKKKLVAEPSQVSQKMGLRSGRVLSQSQFVRVVGEWALRLGQDNVAAALAHCFDLTEAIDRALPVDKNPTDAEFDEILAAAKQAIPAAPLARQSTGFTGRIVMAHLLSSLCLPARVMQGHRLRPFSWFERMKVWTVRLAWLLGRGKVQLLFVEPPVPLSRIERTRPILQGGHKGLVSDYLFEIIQRRQGMTRQTYLHRVLIDLALMAVLISRYARAFAAAESTAEPSRQHIQEGIGVAELLFTLDGETDQSPVLQQVRLKLMSDRRAFRRLLAAEV